MNRNVFIFLITLLFISSIGFAQQTSKNISQDDVAQVVEKLINKYGTENTDRINRGVQSPG